LSGDNLNYLCPYCKKIETFTVDVVHRSYFHDFMQILKNDFQGSLKTLQNNQELIAEGAKN
jgi:phage FluMu protein Com